MATVLTASRSPLSLTTPRSPVPVLGVEGSRAEHRGLAFWMHRVLEELEKVRKSPDPDAVHDLRVAIRRCRSVAAVMEEVDQDSAWLEIRKVARKLFHGLGALRDTQVMDEWVKKLGAEGDPLRGLLVASLDASENELRESALRIAGKFDEKEWKRLERRLRQRARLVPAEGLAAECLALERFEEAKELHARALRTEKPKPWHALRIGLKRFRYTVEGLLPEHYAAWNANLKRMQDLLGEVHDLDVLSEMVGETGSPDITASLDGWRERIARERRERIDTYRHLTLGRTSLWNAWRHDLPHGERLEAAVMARLRATARAADANPRRTAQVSRIALAVFDALRRVNAGPVFHEPVMRRTLRAAAVLHGIGVGSRKLPAQKAARQFLLDLCIPPHWTAEEWDLLAWTVRYHRGEEPKTRKGTFAKLGEEQQKAVLGLAGVLRLARALRKCGVQNTSGMRAEKSLDAVSLRMRGLPDSAETAARLAAGKHLLENYLEKPLILKSAGKTEIILTLPQQELEPQEVSSAASD